MASATLDVSSPKQTATYQHILVPLDGSPEAEAVLPRIIPLAERLGSRLTLVQVLTPATVVLAQSASGLDSSEPVLAVDPLAIVEAERQEADAYLKRAARRLRSRGLSVAVQHPEGTPASAIFDVAKRVEADLIAMTTHARGIFARLIFGSVAEDVLHDAPCPVLLVRVHDPADVEK